jgi:hypothetical protein
LKQPEFEKKLSDCVSGQRKGMEIIMRSFFKQVLKIFLAGICAVIFLSILCLFYYRSSLYVKNASGVTDTVAEPYSTYCYATEGFGYGKMNNEGFQNEYDYHGQPITVLLAGSSQMEGFQVPQHLTASSLLNNFFNDEASVYNIAKGGNSFDIQCKNFERALGYYKPKFVVIETMTVQFPIAVLKKISENSVSKNYTGFNFLGFDITKVREGIRKSPLKYLYYIRLAAKQINLLAAKEFPGGNSTGVFKETVTEEYINEINRIIGQVSHAAQEHSVKPVILYHPALILNKDAFVTSSSDNEYLEAFMNACRENDVFFVDMTKVFMQEYENRHVLPRGFSNTHVGSGHLNRYGHKMIAEELYRIIIRMDAL